MLFKAKRHHIDKFDSLKMESFQSSIAKYGDMAQKFLAGDEERKPGIDYSRRVVAMCAMVAALSYCDRTNMSVAIVAISVEMGWNDHEKARVLGGFFWGYLFSQFAGAFLSQRYGGRQVLGLAAVAWSLLTWYMPILARMHVGYLVFGRFLLGLAEVRYTLAMCMCAMKSTNASYIFL